MPDLPLARLSLSSEVVIISYVSSQRKYVLLVLQLFLLILYESLFRLKIELIVYNHLQSLIVHNVHFSNRYHELLSYLRRLLSHLLAEQQQLSIYLLSRHDSLLIHDVVLLFAMVLHNCNTFHIYSFHLFLHLSRKKT